MSGCRITAPPPRPGEAPAVPCGDTNRDGDCPLCIGPGGRRRFTCPRAPLVNTRDGLLAVAAVVALSNRHGRNR